MIRATGDEAKDAPLDTLVLVMESEPNAGFDQFALVNTTSGMFDCMTGNCNLMEESIVLSCSSSVMCDKNRVSAYDPVDNRIYFKGHLDDGSSATGTPMLNYIEFMTWKVSGYFGSIVSTPQPNYVGGSTGFQWVVYL